MTGKSKLHSKWIITKNIRIDWKTLQDLRDLKNKKEQS